MVHLYEVTGNTLVAKQQMSQPGALYALSYSHDGKHLAACDGNRNIYLYELPEYKVCSGQASTARYFYALSDSVDNFTQAYYNHLSFRIVEEPV